MARYLLLGLLLAVACKKPIDLKKEEAAYDAYLEALPELRVVPKDKPVLLSVVYVENPHLPTLDVAARQRVYDMYVREAYQDFSFDNNSYKPLTFSAGVNYRLYKGFGVE